MAAKLTEGVELTTQLKQNQDNSNNPFEAEIRDKTGGEIRVIIQELEKSIKYDSAGKLRRNTLNGPRRKAITNKIVIAQNVLEKK